MKKILTLLLVLVLSVSYMVSCDKIPGLDKLDIKLPWAEEETPETPDAELPDDTTDDEKPQPEPPAVDAGLESAYNYIHNLTKTIPEVTGANYTVYTSAPVGDKSYPVTWTVTSDQITIVPNEDGVTATVVIPKVHEEIKYTLKFTVTNEKGETLSREYNHVVPEFEVNTHEEYMNAESGKNLVVKGVVVAINSKSYGNTRNHLFLADEDVVGGYYIYQMDIDPVAELGIEVGMTVLVTGPASPYSGMQEIKGGVAEIISTEKKTVAPVDITDLYASGADLANFVGLPVTIKNVTIGGQKLGGTNDYLYFTLNGREAYLRSYRTDFPTSLPMDSKAGIESEHAAHYNWNADVTGILILYSGNPYLIPMSADCFNYISAKELSPAEKVADSLANITIPGTVTADTTLELPLVGKNYGDVALTWTVDNADFTIGEDGKLVIKLGSSAVTLKLTATATLGEATETKEFTVEVSANLVMNEKHVYTGFVNQVTNGTALYLDGGVNGRYLTTTTDPSKAVAIYAEKAEGGYKLYILGDDGAKLYITIYNNADGKTSVNYDAAGETVYTYNKSVNAWTTVFGGKDVYLGCYNNFETVSVSNLSYITPENTGVSQFPLEILDVLVNAPINMFVNQVTNGTVLYLDGGVSGRYLTTTTDLAAAVAVYAEKVAGGYKFYILGEDGAKLYITIYNNADGKTSVNYDAAGETVYTYNPTVNAWTTVFGGKEVYLGTYSNFATISVSNLSYITPENTGVSQFPLDIVAGAPATEEHTCEFVAGETKAPTCTEDGYTVYTCSCGKTENRDTVAATGHTLTDATCVAPKTCTVCQATEGEALGHNFVDGTCANGCGTTEEHVCEFVASEKVVAPTCTDAGYTVYTCTCGLTENRDHVDALGHDEITTTTPATCAAAGSVVVSCDRCKEVLSTTAIDKLAHVDADGDFKCDAECGAVVEPAADSVLTIEQALALGALYAKDTYTTNKYYVTGTIKNVYQTTYGNMYITDASGKELCVYGTYDATGATRYDKLEYKPVTGDEVTVYGVIGFYTAAQMKNGWLDEIVAHEHDYVASVTEATCTSAGFTTHTCSVCSDNYKDTEVPALGHTTENGVCDNCGNTIGGETAVSEYVKVTSADQFTTGTYVLIVSTKNVTVSTFDGSWIKGSTLTAGDTIDKSTGDTLAITLEVSGSSVKIKIGGQYVKPKAGNNNGIQAGSYDWAYEFKEDGTIVFKGVGSDTTILAYNVQSAGFRAYKTSTVSGNPSGYPSTFTVYKLVEG